MALDPLLERYYKERLDMMASQAWNDLIEDVKNMLTATNDLSSVQDEKTLHFRRGEVSMMRWIISLKDMSEEAYQQLKDNDENIA